VLEAAIGREVPEPSFAPWRIGDQRVFCSDTTRAGVDFGWKPTTSPSDGLARMVAWLDSIGPVDLGP